MVEEQGTGKDHPFSGEKLSVVLALYRYDGAPAPRCCGRYPGP